MKKFLNLFVPKSQFSKLFGCFLLFSFGTLPLESSTILHDRLKNAKAGNYIVTESNKMITVLAIRSLTTNSLILEEISAPVQALDPYPTSWPEWVQKHAPGHSSWSMLEIDFDNNQLLECYSFSRSAWIQLSKQESFITTILGLSLQPVPFNQMRKVGPEPLNGEPDHRKIWIPSFVCEGRTLPHIDFDVYQTTWPSDSSDFSGNQVFLYFDRLNRSPFPAWIQMTTTHAIASIRMIDSGNNLPTLYHNLPRRVPEFIDAAQKTAKGLRLSLKSPRYYRQFELFAVDLSSPEKEIFPITHTLVNGDGETLHIEIAKSELINNLQPNHRYNWLLVPSGHCEFYTESSRSFLWKCE